MSGIVGNGFMGRGGASGFRFLIDEIPSITNAYSHLKCKEDYLGGWGEVGAGVEYFFDSDNFADLPIVGSNQNLALINQVNGLIDLINNSAYRSSINDWALSTITTEQNGIFNSNQAFSFIGVLTYPISTRTNSKLYFNVGDVNGSDGGIRVIFGTNGRIVVQLRRGLQISKLYSDIINDDNLHIFAVTYDGGLASAGVRLYVDDMTTPLVPSTDTGATMTAGDYLVRVKTWVNRTVGIENGREFEFISSESELSPTDLQTAKDILSQKYTFI